MSTPDLETIRQTWEEVANTLPDVPRWKAAIERWWHADLVYEEDPRWPGSATYRGRDAVREAFEGYAEVMGMANFSVEGVEPGDELAVVIVRTRGDSAAGVPWDHVWGYLCGTRDGQLAFMRAYWDPDEARRDAGVSSSSS